MTAKMPSIMANFADVCIVFRMVSLALSTVVYLGFSASGITAGRILVAVGMAAASVVGVVIFKRSDLSERSAGSIAVTAFEVFTCGIFIILTGGFRSAYLWYFVSLLTVVMSWERFRGLAFAAVLWCFCCALAGRFSPLPHELRAYSADISIGIGFLMVASGFYVFCAYANRLAAARKEQEQLNHRLIGETARKEQALHHIMELYDTFNLFGITDPGKVMDALAGLLSRTIARKGCELVRLNAAREVVSSGAQGLSRGHEAQLRALAGELARDEEGTRACALEDTQYSVYRIAFNGQLLGVLYIAADEERTEVEMAQELFYMNLIRAVLRELDFQEVVEAYIISEEQNRIACEIHDTVIQKMFAVACGLRTLTTQLDAMSMEELSRRLRQLGETVESTMRELRETIYGFRWSVNNRDVFINKLSGYLGEIERINGVTIDVAIDGEATCLTVNQKTTLYRVICEAVNNAVRHGRATRIAVTLSLDERTVTAEIVDNGSGFSEIPVSPSGDGIRNMYRMMSLLNGRVVINSNETEGTAVTCSLPRLG